MTEPGGSKWKKGECLDENQHSAIKKNQGQYLGEFRGPQGKEDCLAVCRLFALTGCEWITNTGRDCYAFFINISVGKIYETSYCYIFNGEMV